MSKNNHLRLIQGGQEIETNEDAFANLPGFNYEHKLITSCFLGSNEAFQLSLYDYSYKLTAINEMRQSDDIKNLVFRKILDLHILDNFSQIEWEYIDSALRDQSLENEQH